MKGINMEHKRLIRFWLLLSVLCLSLGQVELVLGDSDGSYPGQAQIDWLITQQDLDADLVNSYENGEDFAWTFDQSLAVIAFTHAGEIQRAKRVLDKMKELQPSDCNTSWNEWYRLADPCNMDWDWGSLKYVTGPITWMVIAVNFYECRTGDTNYANMARRALCWMDTMMVTDPNGALRYCDGPRCGQYDPGEPDWISTEHNIDAYSAYYWRGMLDANDSYLYKASLILDYLRREMWAPTPGSNCSEDANVFCRGYNDSVLATDGQSWGVLSLGPIGPGGEQFYKSLYWLLDSILQTTCDFNDGTSDVNGFKSESDEQCDYVQVDITESVAAAFFSIGDDPNGIYFHNEMGRTVDPNGGLFHKFNWNQPSCENRHNYVASAVWYYFNEVRLNPFDLRPCSAECRAANIDGTGRINLKDYAIFASDWLEEGLSLAGDINGDRRVQWVDLNILTRYWLSDCNE